jgi:hypothetical protein
LGLDKLKEIIRNGSELSNVLFAFNEAERTSIIEHFDTNKLKEIIRNGSELSGVLSALNEAERRSIIEHFDTDKLKEMIQNGEQLGHVLFWLNEEQFASIINASAQQWLEQIINSRRMLLGVLRPLSDKNQELATIINLFHPEWLQQIITDKEDLGYVLGALNDEQRPVFMRHLARNHLTSLLRQCRNGELSAYRGVFIQVYLSLRTADVRAVFVPGLWRCFQPHREQKMRLTQSLLGNPTQRAHNGLLGLIDRKTRPPSRR